ncbi:MAG: hypothetical protein ACPG5P_01365 [Saprospiraceae bacterium]
MSSKNKLFGNIISVFFVLCITNVLVAQDCDTLDNQWLTPPPTITSYGFGGGWLTGIPDPSNSVLSTDPKGVFEKFPTPNPGIEAVSAVRVGLGSLADANDNTRFDIVVYDDNGAGIPGALLGSETNISPTVLGVPGAGFYNEYWIDITSNPIPTTTDFHVGIIINAGDATDTLIVMTSCLGAPTCATAQGENDASNHIQTSGFGYENLLTVYGADLDINIIPKMGILEDASFNYSSNIYCENEANPSPTITGESGGTFSSSPIGLDINTSTGEINLANSSNNSYIITYETNGTNIGRCSNTENWSLELAATYNQALSEIVCRGDNYTFPDGSIESNITSQIIQTSNLLTINESCDSTIITTINVSPSAFAK